MLSPSPRACGLKAIARVVSEPPVDPVETMRRLRQALDEADALARRMPKDKIGRATL
jgi:hypothetical protein